MRKALLAFMVAGLMGVLLPCSGSAQYYGYYSPYLIGPAPPPPPMAAAPAQAPKRSLHYRTSPDPLLYWKWNQRNLYSDFQEFQRSPGNPESDLSYMLRTF